MVEILIPTPVFSGYWVGMTEHGVQRGQYSAKSDICPHRILGRNCTSKDTLPVGQKTLQFQSEEELDVQV